MQSIPPLVGHRGASHCAPENTLPSYRLAFKEGANRIEGDFWLTSDAQLVCIHDSTTARTAPHQPNRDVTISTRKELENVDVGLWKSNAYKNTPIPTLDEILAELPTETAMYIEIKQDDPKLLTAMFKTAEQYNITLDRLTLISFSEDIVKHAKQLAPELKTYLLHRLEHQEEDGTVASYLEQIIERAVSIHADGLDLKHGPLVDRWFVDKIKKAGLEFHIWVINSAEDALHYMELGADSITTDKPQELRREITAELAKR
ncbi:MAG: glycerophosphodiester phosphodiesterase [Desulfotalea sp.]|nr:MAG: glycerophosphodiester phosphodiesterase [Desulfotalea sp.]